MPRSTKPETPPAAKYLDEQGRLIAPTLARETGAVPVARALPSLRDFNRLSDAALYDTLRVYGIGMSPEKLLATVMPFASKLQNLPPGPVADKLIADYFDEARLRKELVGLARETARQYQTYEVAAGNPAQELAWICEGDEASCDSCAAMGGAVGTFEDLAATGMPEDICEGGNRCRCSLVAFD